MTTSETVLNEIRQHKTLSRPESHNLEFLADHTFPSIRLITSN